MPQQAKILSLYGSQPKRISPCSRDSSRSIWKQVFGTVVLILVSPAFLRGHTGHDTQGEVVWNVKTRSLECAIRVPGVELEAALSTGDTPRVDLARTENVELLLANYVRKSVQVLDYRDRPLLLQWSGYRIESREVWLFFSISVPAPTRPSQLWWRNRLLFQQHADQVNAITFRMGEQNLRLHCSHAAPRQRLTQVPKNHAARLELESQQSLFHGYVRHDFEWRGHQCILVEPHIVAVGRPWVWRARFFGVAPGVDQALLDRGFHLAYIDVANLFGAPPAVERFDQFYAYLTQQHQLAARPVLEGLSRGGLIVYNWAIAHPNRVACIYADAPVCDFRSWPLKHGPPAVARKCLAAYELPTAQAATFRGNPVDRCQVLAQAGVPAIHVVGTADRVVPVAENTEILAQRYRAAGGPMLVLRKPGIGHHPHGLEDPQPITDYILSRMLTAAAPAPPRPQSLDAASVPTTGEIPHTPPTPRTPGSRNSPN